MAAVELRTLPVSYEPARRLVQLAAGLALNGATMGKQVRTTLGLNPPTVPPAIGPLTQLFLPYVVVRDITPARPGGRR